MRFRFILLLVASFLVIIHSGYSTDCYFDSRDSSCEVFSEPFNRFIMGFDDENDLQSFSAKIYPKSNPFNELKVDISGNEVKNLDPFVNPGTYILMVTTTNRVGRVKENRFEFIFDNLRPNPPIVSLDLNSLESSIDIFGNAKNVNKVVGVRDDGKEFSVLVSDRTGDFTLNVELNDGLNYFEFYSIGFNGLESKRNQRVIYQRNTFDINYLSEISNIVIDNVSLRNSIDFGITMDRNFYVSGGVGIENTLVYVNGNPTVSDLNGKFGSFVLLNEGENLIEIVSGGISKNFEITYVKPRFKFLEIDFDKVVSKNSVVVYGKSNLNVPFSVFLNGEFVDMKNFSDGSFSLYGLRPGKNYLYLEGFNGERVFDTIYFDDVKPNIDMISFEKLNSKGDLIFRVYDEFGVDIPSFDLNIDGDPYPKSLLRVYDDYYMIDISELDLGDHEFSVSVFDLAGNVQEMEGRFSTSDINLNFDEITFSNGGIAIGDQLLIRDKTQKITLNPNRNTAFKSIFLDGVRQNKYFIKFNNEVDIDLIFENTTGEIELNFIDSEGLEFSKIYHYKVLDSVDFSLNQIIFDSLPNNNRVKIFGEIESPYFDWNSFKFGDNKVMRFGDHFEAYVNPSDVIEVSGNDFLNNQVVPQVISGVGLDSSNIDIELIKLGNMSFQGSLDKSNFGDLNFVSNYDGFVFNGFLSKNFNLPVSQRQGIRSINLEGFENGFNKFNSLDTISVDGLKPKVYFTDSEMIVDGTLSEVVRVEVDSESIGVGSECVGLEKISLNCKVFNLPNISSSVSVVDAAGNKLEVVYDGNINKIPSNEMNLKIYFSGNDILTKDSIGFIQGQILSSSVVKSVRVVGGDDCVFDDWNFVCFINLNEGNNLFKVQVENENGEIVKDTYGVIRDSRAPNIDLNDISGDKVYKSLDEFYLSSNEFDVLGSVSERAIISLMINGYEFRSGIENGSFVLNDVSVQSIVSGEDSKEMEVQLVAQDDLGNRGVSNIVKVYYSRILETLLDIVIG